MKTLAAILIVLSFLQATIIPFDLVLIVLVIRAYINVGRSNLILAFVFGLFVSHVMVIPWGLQSVVYLVLVQVAQLVSKSPLSQNPLVVVPLVFVLISINEAVISNVLQQSIAFWPKIAFGLLISLPVYLIFKFWQDRFVVKNEVRLKLKN